MHKSNCRGASRHSAEHPTHWLICVQVAKHDKLIKEPEKCFPHLKGFDPNAPEPTGIAIAQTAAKKKVKKKKEEDLSDLLAAGLNVGKKKK